MKSHFDGKEGCASVTNVSKRFLDNYLADFNTIKKFICYFFDEKTSLIVIKFNGNSNNT
jgi:hypothetical protein